jgi:hypothetical protein
VPPSILCARRLSARLSVPNFDKDNKLLTPTKQRAPHGPQSQWQENNQLANIMQYPLGITRHVHERERKLLKATQGRFALHPRKATHALPGVQATLEHSWWNCTWPQ